MLVYQDSMIVNKDFIPFFANELVDKKKKTKGSMYFITTADGYFINVPENTLVSAKLKSDRSSKYHEKFLPIEELYTGDKDDYSILLYRPTLDEWKQGIFSNVVYKSTIQELVVSSFFLSYKMFSKNSDRILLKSARNLKERLNSVLSKKLDIYARSYNTKQELYNQLTILNDRINAFPESITNDDFTIKDPIQYRINRLVGYLLLVTRSFGSLMSKQFIIDFNSSISDDRIRAVQIELLIDGIISTMNEDEMVLTIDFTKFYRTMSIISELLFDMKKSTRNYYTQKIKHIEKIDDVDMIEFDDYTEMWVDGVKLKQK